MDVNTLTNDQIDILIAHLKGVEIVIKNGRGYLPLHCGLHYSPSLDWARGGPLIDNYDISCNQISKVHTDPRRWQATKVLFDDSGEQIGVTAAIGYGNTQLQAAMRFLLLHAYPNGLPLEILNSALPHQRGLSHE